MDASVLLRRRPAVLVVLGAAFLLVWVSWRTCGLSGCPDVDTLTAYQPGGGSVLLDRDGTQLAEIGRTQHEKVALADLPRYVADAFLAVEDQRFYQHGGVDWRRAAGALLANLRAAGFRQGFSTISMQLARNVFADDIPGAERTLGRKLLEIRVAGAIEARFSKDEILELYLNHIYFGNGARGIAAAAQTYFGRPAAELTLPQAALLAAMIKAPTRYDARHHPGAARRRRDLVLQLMAQQARISAAEAQRAQQMRLAVVTAPPPHQPVHSAPYFVQEVRRQLEARFGERIYRESLRVWTTLDRDIQRAAEQEMERQLRRFDRASPRGAGPAAAADGKPDSMQGALVVLSAHDGDVLAWIGGRDYTRSQFDRVRAARRQVGSAFKPFVYAAALGRGFSLSQLVADEPLRVTQSGGRVWQPHNFKDDYDGVVTLREALMYSKNVATVRLANEVGYDAVAALARRAGISSRIDDLPSMALGAAQISPLELTAAYTAFAAGGEAVAPRLLLRVTRADGSPLWQSQPRRKRALPAVTAFLITDVLRDAVDHGTSRGVREAGFSAPAAGKTGTTNDGTDVWFVGYTPELVAGIWLGFDQPRPIGASATGGQLAAPVWGNLMRRVYATRRVDATRPGPHNLPADWQIPEGVVRRSIDPESGRPLPPGCVASFAAPQHEYFIQGKEPPAYCPGEQAPPADAVIGGDRLIWKQPAERHQAQSVAATRDSLDTPPANESAAVASGREVQQLAGDWQVVHRIQSTSYAAYEGMQLGYRVHLTQRGARLFGSGRKWTENGRSLRPAARTPIDIEGRIDGGLVKLHFVEHGTQRSSDGEIVWRTAGDDMSGSFTSSVADSRGSSRAQRIDAPLRRASSRERGERRRQWPAALLDDVVKTPRTIADGIGRLFR